MLIKPVCDLFCFWSKRLKIFLWCGVQHDSLEVSAELSPAVAQKPQEHMRACAHVRAWAERRNNQPSTAALELLQGMLHKQHRLEMKSAKPWSVVSYLLFPFSSNMGTQALRKQRALRKARN